MTTPTVLDTIETGGTGIDLNLDTIVLAQPNDGLMRSWIRFFDNSVSSPDSIFAYSVGNNHYTVSHIDGFILAPKVRNFKVFPDDGVYDPDNVSFIDVVGADNVFCFDDVIGIHFRFPERGIRLAHWEPPDSLEFLSILDIPYTLTDVEFRNNFVYVTNNFNSMDFREANLSIYEIENPQNPHHLGSASEDWLRYERVSLIGNYAYVVGPEIRIFDITNPVYPFVIAIFDAGPDVFERDIHVENNIAYLSTSESLLIYDVTNLDEWVLLGQLGVTLYDIVFKDGIIFGCQYEHIVAIDARDVTNPVLLDQVDIPQIVDWDVQINKIYVATYRNGIYIIDIDWEGIHIEDEERFSSKTQLHQNYPNPFNPHTTISWSQAARLPVLLSIYNTAGQLVRSLVNQPLDAGEHTATWDGLNDIGQQAGSGIYFYRLQTADRTETKRMVLLR